MGFTSELVDQLDAVGDWGLLVTDANFVITGWNRWLERHAGLPADAVRGRALFDVFPELLIRKLDRYYHQVLGGQVVILSQRFHKYVLPLAPPSTGSRFDRMQQACRVVPLVNDGAVNGTVTVIEDVTERVAYETELRERVEALREADRRKDEFLATLAHELRNPLAPIRNALQIMQLTADATTHGKARDLIDRQIGHMVRLVDDLMEVSRITRGKVSLHALRIDLRTVVNTALETSRPLIEAARHELSVSLPSKPLYVDGDLTRLAQVVSNLLNNAAKYTLSGGQIGITVNKSGGQAVLRVEDNGLGISSEMLPRIFELFTQVDHSLERSQGGLGIGLALVKKLIEMHHGSVDGHSEGLGKGAAFTVRLPLSPEEKPSMPEQGISAKLPKSDKRRVLVVDDNIDAATSLASVLQLSGHEVHSVHDGVSAIAAAEEFRPNIILMDIGMPGLNGYDACRRIRSEPWGDCMILVALSGWGQEDDRLRATEVGFNLHLTKPIDSTALKDVLNWSTHHDGKSTRMGNGTGSKKKSSAPP
jgi:PAS domain S-box-containing protein